MCIISGTRDMMARPRRGRARFLTDMMARPRRGRARFLTIPTYENTRLDGILARARAHTHNALVIRTHTYTNPHTQSRCPLPSNQFTPLAHQALSHASARRIARLTGARRPPFHAWNAAHDRQKARHARLAVHDEVLRGREAQSLSVGEVRREPVREARVRAAARIRCAVRAEEHARSQARGRRDWGVHARRRWSCFGHRDGHASRRGQGKSGRRRDRHGARLRCRCHNEHYWSGCWNWGRCWRGQRPLRWRWLWFC